LGHYEASIAAGVDRGKWGKIHVDIERQAVVAAAILDREAERGTLGVADIDAGCASPAFGREV
jgi:hypothetical protein